MAGPEPPILCQQAHGPHGGRDGGSSAVADVVMVSVHDWLMEMCWRHAARLADHLQRVDCEWE